MASTGTSSGKEFVLDVIEKYRALPCLGQLTHHEYHDKNKRNTALDSLLTIFKSKDPEANKETVLKKINSLRGAFKKEYNKVKTSQRSGTGTDEVHVPKLWYYDQMLFLEEQETPRPSRTPLSILDRMPFGEIEETAGDYEYIPSPSSQTSSASRQSHPLGSHCYKKTKANADAVLSKISTSLDAVRARERNVKRKNLDSFGEHVAEQLRDMPDRPQKICMKIINDALFLASIGNLDISSRIVTDPPTTYIPQPSQNDSFTSQSLLLNSTFLNTDIETDIIQDSINNA